MIEEGCGRELVLRLKNLRDEVITMSNKNVAAMNVSYAEDTVEVMAKEISHRVKQLVT